ncbi:D-erythronate dehydrogenase-like [Aricia agestis]|uniref:D-erythronate dehydrogenase-like n=1 Tax=Aricia agestis TaxID=91739 RepID=UPI001C204149|nr:D-erythronate dehydrogenase-like [Aricia agestis]
MNIIITGAAGFLGSRLADLLLEKSEVPVNRLLLVDTIAPTKPKDPRVSCLAIDLTANDAAERIIQPGCNLVFHLAAVVSGHAEADFDYGMQVNFEATRALLERIRHTDPSIKFVLTSTVGVFGGELPPVIDDFTATTPQNSYGTAKAMSELLINDYSRRGYVDGRIVRLPTVSVRAGAANQAVTSFASGIIREPLKGEMCEVPVSRDQGLWLTSPETVLRNIVHGAVVPTEALGQWRAINLPGFTVTVQEMIDALAKVAGKKATDLIVFKPDEKCSRIVASLPIKFDNKRALTLGFEVDKDFVEVIKSYIRSKQ